MSRMTIKTLVMSYLYNRSARLEAEEEAKRQFCRYHHCDEVDYTELIIAKARKDLINEITRDIMNLLGIIEPNSTK